MDSLLKKGRLAKLVSLLGYVCVALGCSTITPNPPPKEEMWPNWSPDGQQLVYECYLDGPIEEGSRSILDFDEGEGIYQSFYTKEAADICIFDFSNQHQVHLIQDDGGDWRPTWSPDGLHIAYLRRDGLYLITADGRDRRRLVSFRRDSYDDAGSYDSTNIIWSPDGDRILFSACLDHPDRDIYIVDVKTGAVDNLTSRHRTQDVAPTWTLNGTKVIFLSTMSSLFPGTCTLKRDAPHRLKVIDVDGKNERLVYDKEFNYYALVSVTNNGQIIFVADMISKTRSDYVDSITDLGVYEIGVTENEPVQMLSIKNDEAPIGWFSLSPNRKYLAYESFPALKIRNLHTEEIIEVSPLDLLVENFVWSPDATRIAATVSIQQDQAIDREEHIYIFDIQTGIVSSLLPE